MYFILAGVLENISKVYYVSRNLPRIYVAICVFSGYGKKFLDQRKKLKQFKKGHLYTESLFLGSIRALNEH